MPSIFEINNARIFYCNFIERTAFSFFKNVDFPVPFLQAENLSKRWGELMLFEDISFTVFEGHKVALIAKNGAGKSTLLNLLAGKETPDEGIITLTNDVEVGYFEQIPDLNPNHTVIEEIFDTDNEKLKAVKAFELAVAHDNQEEIAAISTKMDELNAWAIEVEIKQILTQLKINFLEQKVAELSGGQHHVLN